MKEMENPTASPNTNNLDSYLLMLGPMTSCVGAVTRAFISTVLSVFSRSRCSVSGELVNDCKSVFLSDVSIFLENSVCASVL